LLRDSLDKQTRKLVTAEMAKNVSAFARQDLDACLQALARPRQGG
jgi:protein required for attachment to host cells